MATINWRLLVSYDEIAGNGSRYWFLDGIERIGGFQARPVITLMAYPLGLNTQAVNGVLPERRVEVTDVFILAKRRTINDPELFQLNFRVHNLTDSWFSYSVMMGMIMS